jgi:hypothetical protein
MHCKVLRIHVEAEGVLSLHSMLETLSHCCSSYCTIPLGDYTHILDDRMAKGSMV